MAEMEFSKHVSQPAQGQELPKPYHRKVTPEVTNIPDIQSAVSQYAAASNWMSSVGSYVAERASNEIASQIGTRLGKNPQGDLGMSFTDFDKAMKESYKTQSQATLGIQANKLITESNIEAAKATRITPQLIAKTERSVSIGLQNIFKNAPQEIRQNLEYQYSTQQLHLSADLTERMIKEQRQDQKNALDLSNNTNAEQAYSLSLRGDFDAANRIVESTKRANAAGAGARFTSPEAAKTAVDTVRKSALRGKYVHDYEQARRLNKGEEYLKNLADNKPSDLSDSDYFDVTNGLMNYANHQQALRSQDEQLHLAKFNTAMTQNVMGITGSQIQELKEAISPTQFEKAQASYFSAVKKFRSDQNDENSALLSWNDPQSFARAGEKGINKAFDTLVARQVKEGQASGQTISRDQAEVQVAATAGGAIPVFTKSLKNKINSGNPAMMDEAASQVHDLHERNANHALLGLNDSDKRIIAQYKGLSAMMPADEAAKMAIQNANQDFDTQQANAQAFSSKLRIATGNFSTTPSKHGLEIAKLHEDEFLNKGVAFEYGNLIIQSYAAHYQSLNRDDNTAKELIQQEVKENFGYTYTNGGKQMTLHPIEKVLGYEGNSDIVPFIQSDMIGTLNKSFTPMKELFDKGQSTEYWETVQREPSKTFFGGTKYEPVQVKRHIKTDKGVKTDTYNVMLVGNSFNWDLVLETGLTYQPISRIAPYLGVQTYTPNRDAITKAYVNSTVGKHHG